MGGRPRKLKQNFGAHRQSARDESQRKGKPATVLESIYLGSSIRFILDLDGHQIIAEVSASDDNARTYRRGATVKVNMSPTDLVALNSKEK